MNSTETDTLDAVDFDPVLPCEDGLHYTSTGGCVAEMPGEFWMVAPCCDGRAVVCDGRRAYLQGPTVAQIMCARCIISHHPDTYRYIPITES
jgi:hypothetical protein